MTKEEVNRVVDATLRQFNIDINKYSLKDACQIFKNIYDELNIN